MRARTLVVALAAALTITGCNCGGGGLGERCDDSQDCDPGLFCDPSTLTCETTGQSDAGADSGSDTGLDATTTLDSNVCVDADGDGVTDCAGDCDDNDISTYPGAPEQCGDGITNDCLSMAPPDQGCMNLGTYVAPPPLGDPMNPGTQAAPVDTIGGALTNAGIIGMGVDVFVAAGTYDGADPMTDITMVEGTSILGGYESTGWTRDPVVNVTIINNVGHNGVLFPDNITRATSIDGFTINGVTDPNNANTITVMANSSPEITNNILNGPSTGGRSSVISINPNDVAHAGNALIEGNEIYLGDSNTGWGTNNGSYGIIGPRSDVEILNNRIFLADNNSNQWGININRSPSMGLIAWNVIRGTGNAEVAFGISAGNGNIVIDNNDVDPGACFNFCTAINTNAGFDPGSVVITNNIAFGGDAFMSSSGLDIFYENNVPPLPVDIVVHSNFFSGGASAMGRSSGLRIGENPMNPMVAARVYNNIIYSGVGMERFCVFELGANIDYEAFENNALNLESGGTFTGALYMDEGTVLLTDIMMVNALDFTGMPASSFANNIEDDCGVTNPVVGGDFHLMAGSACIDSGTSADLPALDYEGDSRPMGAGPDIGPDETP